MKRNEPIEMGSIYEKNFVWHSTITKCSNFHLFLFFCRLSQSIDAIQFFFQTAKDALSITGA